MKMGMRLKDTLLAPATCGPDEYLCLCGDVHLQDCQVGTDRWLFPLPGCEDTCKMHRPLLRRICDKEAAVVQAGWAGTPQDGAEPCGAAWR